MNLIYILEQLGVEEETETLMSQSGYLDISYVFFGVIPRSGLLVSPRVIHSFLTEAEIS